MSSQKHVIARLELQPGSKVKIQPVLKELIEMAQGEAGTLKYSAFFDGEDAVYFYEVYKDDLALKIHMKNLKALGGKLAPFLAGPPDIKVLEHAVSKL